MKAEEELKSYNLFKQLGKGRFGKVFLTVKDINPVLLSTKVIDISKIKNDKKTLEYLKREKEIMKELDHPNIIKLNNFIEFNDHYFFIMEYCNGGTLSDLLKKYLKKYRKSFTLEIIQYYMRQIVEGLKYIHSKDIIHRDLKLLNILVHFKNIRGKAKVDTVDFNDLDDKDLFNSTIKIIDFGLSFILKKPDDLAKSGVGSPFNMDPLVLKKYYQEISKGSNGNPFNKGSLILKKYQKAGGYENDLGYSKEVDIWSLGTICYQMLTGDPLFSAKTIDDLVIKVEEGNYSIPFDIEISNEIISFLNSMLQYNGKFRSSIEDLSKNVFLKGDAKLFTKIDYQKQPNAYIIINNLKNFIYINNHKKLENSKEKYLNYIDSLYDDYKEVRQYFKENELFEKEKDAIQKCLQIEKIKRQLNSGIKIYLIDLPKKINPEYIYGCSIEERNKIFKQILLRNRAEKNLLEVKLKIFQNKENISKNDKDEYEKNKINYDKLKSIIEHLEKSSKNIWVPPPIFKKEIQKQSKEIISFDKNIFKIKIIIKRIDNINDSLDLIIILVINQEKELKKKVELKAQYSYKEWEWILNAEEWMNIDNNISNFILKIKIDKFFNKNPEIYTDISKIKTEKNINLNQEIIDKNTTKKINISIIPIIPEGKKSIIYGEKEIITLQKIYPPFELKSNNDKNNFEKPSKMDFNIKNNKTKI